MNVYMKVLLIVLGIGFHATFYSVNSLQNSSDELDQIECCEIIYRWSGRSMFYYEYHKITRENGVYRTNMGKEIDKTLIHSLAESLTDLYETDTYEESYENQIILDHGPHFVVRLRLANGKRVILKSDSDYHCFIPWNVEYNNKLYVQYNGKIPTALVRILEALGEEWSFYKESRWGCYSAVVPERYAEKGVSQDFPQTTSVLIPDQELGRKHLSWKISMDSAALSAPVYANGNVFVISLDGVFAFGASTGEEIWKVLFEEYDRSNPLSYYTGIKKIAVHQGVLYVCGPDSLVYALDCETGKCLWKYRVHGQLDSVLVFDNKIVVKCGLSPEGCWGMFCLDGGTGEKIWEIEVVILVDAFYDDKVLVMSMTKESHYYALIDIESGAELWKKDISKTNDPSYYEGMMYYEKREVHVVACESILPSKEVWSFDCNKAITYMGAFEEEILLTFYQKRRVFCLEAFENGILLAMYNLGDSQSWRELFLDSITLLDLNGSVIWSYYYPWESVEYNVSWVSHFKIARDKVFFTRERGVMEVFDLKNGEKLWETEVRGMNILDSEVHTYVYAYANDGRFYCLDINTGEILWFFETEKDFAEFSEDYRPIFASDIGDGFVFIATKYGNVFALSLDEFFSGNMIKI
ncbi:MAG: PQQ-binding-like beta-propeller repeat protein [Theionarchaea archaeon]|nr:PQQ-binding-like beta-propeller repeat protein [Theionarchaea archaeon]